MKDIPIKAPPQSVQIPIVHKITKLYVEIYNIGNQIPKRDKLGLHAKIENLCIEILGLSIKAALTEKESKIPIINEIRIRTEIIKHLVRASNHLKIIDDKEYIRIEESLQEISKMAAGWLNFLKQNPA